MKFLIRARVFFLAFGLCGLFFQGMNSTMGMPMNHVRMGVIVLDVIALLLGIVGLVAGKKK